MSNFDVVFPTEVAPKDTKPDIVRVLRILEYVGPRDDLARSLAQNAVKGYAQFGKITVREAFVSNYPEILEQPSEQH